VSKVSCLLQQKVLAVFCPQLKQTGDLVTGTANSHANSVAMGDVNGDGRVDVVVTNSGAANELYLGNAAGGLTRQTTEAFDQLCSYKASGNVSNKQQSARRRTHIVSEVYW
jgi:hypothetical protein